MSVFLAKRLLTLIAAGALTVRVINHGAILAFDKQFFGSADVLVFVE